MTRRRIHWPRWSLRRTLLVSVVVLFVTLTALTSAATVVVMDRVLTQQVDAQLEQRAERDGRGGPPCGAGPGLGDGALVVCEAEDGPDRGFVISQDDEVDLTDAQLETVIGADVGETPTTLEIPDLGSYRVVAHTTEYGGQRYSPDDQVTVISGESFGDTESAVRQLLLIVTLAGLAGLAVVLTVGTWLISRNLLPLRRVAGLAHRVSALRLDSGEVALAERVPEQDADPRTEVGQVGQALNNMLDNVGGALAARQESEMRLRQFVADASHELRTPLASIRGYAELSHRETEPVPPSIRHGLDRVESEALRMQGLVEDLLLLARLDAGRPLEREPVDLSMLTITVVGDAGAAAPDHRWQLDLPPEPVEVTGDSARLTQVLVNLLANARTHTPPGTTVTTSVTVEGQDAILRVEDDGPGIPSPMLGSVFDRFTRGDESRNRAGGSTGLGLSIVTSVVAAHGGEVQVSSTPGSTIFEVRLPVMGPPSEPLESSTPRA